MQTVRESEREDFLFIGSNNQFMLLLLLTSKMHWNCVLIR